MKLTVHPIGCYQMYDDDVVWFTAVFVELIAGCCIETSTASAWLRDNAEMNYRVYPHAAYFESSGDAELFVLRFSS